MISSNIHEQYGLPYDIAANAIEIGVTRALANVLDKPIMARYDENGLEIFLLEKGVQEPIPLSTFKRKTRRHILNQVELELMKKTAVQDSLRIASLRGAVITGRIDRINREGTLLIGFEISHGFRSQAYFGICPVRKQPLHERGRYRTEETKPFVVEACHPMSDGNHAWVSILVSRTTRTLPALLLTELTGISGIKCRRRSPGGESLIITRRLIPKSAINTVGKELKEHIDVVVQPQQ